MNARMPLTLAFGCTCAAMVLDCQVRSAGQGGGFEFHKFDGLIFVLIIVVLSFLFICMVLTAFVTLRNAENRMFRDGRSGQLNHRIDLSEPSIAESRSHRESRDNSTQLSFAPGTKRLPGSSAAIGNQALGKENVSMEWLKKTWLINTMWGYWILIMGISLAIAAVVYEIYLKGTV